MSTKGQSPTKVVQIQLKCLKLQ